MSNQQRGLVLSQFSSFLFDVRGASENTRRQYGARMLAAERWMIEHCNTSTIWADEKTWRKWLFSLPPTARSRNFARQAAVAFTDFLCDKGYAKTSVARKLPRIPEKPHSPKAIRQEQLAAVLEAVEDYPPKVQAIIHTLAYSGMRNAEVRRLQWSDIDFEGRWIRFVAKGAKERVIPIHETLLGVLKAWKFTCDSPRWVFPSSRTDGPVSESWLHGQLGFLARDVGLPKLHAHIFRHTFATMLLDADVNLPTIQSALGHNSISSTSIYLKVRPQGLRDAFAKIDPCSAPVENAEEQHRTVVLDAPPTSRRGKRNNGN